MNKNNKWLDQSVHTGLKLQSWYFDPIFLNTSSIQTTRPALYVGNHTLYGVTDAPLLWEYLYQVHGIHLKALADDIHFQIPVWRDLLMSQGVVRGSPENCSDLMEQGESILVFPGGAREVFKRKNEKYQLIWKQRTGFARLALEHGYDIIPFAALGGDECYDIVIDSDDIMQNKASKWLLNKLKLTETVRDGELIPSLATGLAKLPFPRPERMYFSFGERISTSHKVASKNNQWEIREQVAESIEQQMAYLLEYRTKDRADNWSWLRKKLT